MVTLRGVLNLTVMVEGVETKEQRVLLQLAGCDEMQGFWFAGPVLAAAIDRLLGPNPKDSETLTGGCLKYKLKAT